MKIWLSIDVGSSIIVIITMILWSAILVEKFIHPHYKHFFRGTRLWPAAAEERNRIKKCLQGVGLYYFFTVILLLFSPALGLLMGFGGIFYTIFLYYWFVVAKQGERK